MSNIAPNISKIIGPSNVKTGEEIKYKILTTDLDGDNLYNYKNWNENTSNITIGPYESGEEVTVSQVWENKGIYAIKVKVVDIENHESDYTTLDTKITKNKLRFNILL